MDAQALEETKKLLMQVNGYDLIQFFAQEPQLLKDMENAMMEWGIRLKENFAQIELYPELTHLVGFESLVGMVEKTQNVNRSNIAAVLSVASRKSAELRAVVDAIERFFDKDMERISGFFREYFEKKMGWNFNKFNRRDGIKPEFKQTSGIWVQLAKHLQEQATSMSVFVQLVNDKK